jgi:hypothetical protein
MVDGIAGIETQVVLDSTSAALGTPLLLAPAELRSSATTAQRQGS